jgi:hypothetical protein
LLLGLLLVSLTGGSAAGATPATRMTVAPHAFPASSCQGAFACTNVTGSVGAHSCDGHDACYHSNPWAGSVGSHSCDDDSACIDMGGNAADGACNAAEACAQATGGIGTGSCNGIQACYLATGTVGRYACNGDNACSSTGTSVPDCADNLPGSIPAPCLGTRTVMGSSADPATAGELISLWARVFARYPVVGGPGGMFQFRIDGVTLPNPVALDWHGRATITRILLHPGVHHVSGRYLGDSAFRASIPVPLILIVVR